MVNKRVIAILVATLLALIAATVWVPTRIQWVPHRNVGRGHPSVPSSGPFYVEARPVLYRWIWKTEFGDPDDRAPIDVDYTEEDSAEWGAWEEPFLDLERFALTHALILAAGGLVALFLRTRAARATA